MANTPNVAAPLWSASQASPWLTQNQAARIWDAFAVTVLVERMDLTAPPGSCADGARYLVHGTATGAWAGHDGDLAIAVGANAANGWYFAEVGLEGMLLYNRADATNYRYRSGVWTSFSDAVSRFQDLLDVDTTGLVDGDVFVWDASNGVLFAQTLAHLLAGYLQATLDTDTTLAANSDTRVPSQKAIKSYIDLAVTGLLDLKGGQDCSGNPNYPAASKGDAYVVTVAGKIGGATGTSVNIGDVFFATADNAGGTQAAVGSSWDVMLHSATFSGGLIAANNLSDVADPATAGANIRPVESLIIACSDETTAITAATGKVTFRMPYAFTVTAVRASLVVAQTSGSIFTVDINESGVSIISTKLTIDNTEKTSTTAATPAVISDASLADDAEITVDVDQIGDGTAKGLKIVLIGHRT